jgi:hypothetical protein
MFGFQSARRRSLYSVLSPNRHEHLHSSTSATCFIWSELQLTREFATFALRAITGDIEMFNMNCASKFSTEQTRLVLYSEM